MKFHRSTVVTAFLMAISLPASAREIRVMLSGGFSHAYTTLAHQFESFSGDSLVTIKGPSMGASRDSIPHRLERGEHADVLILDAQALDAMIAGGQVRADSRVILAQSGIGVVVRAGQPMPDISSVDALRETLLRANSIAVSASGSGRYVMDHLVKQLGIENEIKDRIRVSDTTPVAEVVAAGDCEIGFQQVSELLNKPGVTYAGRLPEAVQKITRFAAGIPVSAEHPDEAQKLIDYLASPENATVTEQAGLEPATR